MLPKKPRDKPAGRRYIGAGHPADAGMAHYTLPVPRDAFQAFKVLCTIRGETIRDAMRRLILAEVEEAHRKGVLPSTLKRQE